MEFIKSNDRFDSTEGRVDDAALKRAHGKWDRVRTAPRALQLVPWTVRAAG